VAEGYCLDGDGVDFGDYFSFLGFQFGDGFPPAALGPFGFSFGLVFEFRNLGWGIVTHPAAQAVVGFAFGLGGVDPGVLFYVACGPDPGLGSF